MRRPGLDRTKVEAALKEAAWLSIHGTREDKDGIFRGPQLVLPDMEKLRKRMKVRVAETDEKRETQAGLAESGQAPYKIER